MNSTLFFQYCQKLVLFSQDRQSVLLAKRKGEADYDQIFSLVGGKMETTDGSILEGLRRGKTEEIGSSARVRVFPLISYNVFFRKKDGSSMILPHHAAIYEGGDIVINDEYSEYAWVPLNELEAFEPKIESIPEAVRRAQVILSIAPESEFEVI